MKRTTSLVVVLVFLVIMSISYGGYKLYESHPNNLEVTSAVYRCDNNKVIGAKFITKLYQEPRYTKEGIPLPSSRVAITLSDGRSMNLTQTISASGVRYANKDESFIFWVKEKEVLVLEDNEEKTFIGCVKRNTLKTEHDTRKKLHDTSWFSVILPGFSYDAKNAKPDDFIVNESHSYGLIPGEVIKGVSYSIPPSMYQGTNLSPDSYISIEKIDTIKLCNASSFLERSVPVHKETISTIDYTVATSSERSVGNIYQETIYARKYKDSCIAVRYFIHSTDIRNHSPGTKQAFDEKKLLETFSLIRDSLKLK